MKREVKTPGYRPESMCVGACTIVENTICKYVEGRSIQELILIKFLSG